MRCFLSKETNLHILSFLKLTFYESSQANTFCEQFQREHRYMRMVRNKGPAERIAYTIYARELGFLWNTTALNTAHEDRTYPQWWMWLVHTAQSINKSLRDASPVRTWTILVHEFAAVNANALTHRCRRGRNDSVPYLDVLPVWNETPVPWQKFGLHCAERNAHLHQRVNGNSLTTFCQLLVEDPEEPIDTVSPQERSVRLFYGKISTYIVQNVELTFIND